MIAADGEIVYVGKSKRVRSRLLSYFRCAFPEDKGARILREAIRIEWDYMPSEFAALLDELRLIKHFRPRFNVAMKRDGRHYCFIKLTRGARAEAASSCAAPGRTTQSIYYGPFMGAMGVGDAVRELNDVLGLRDCAVDQKMHFADQPELFDIMPRTPGCIRFEIKKVPRPVRRRMHGASVRRARSRSRARFSTASTTGRSNVCAREMEAASERLEFERAGVAARQAPAARGAARRNSPGCASRSRRCRSSTRCPATTATIASISFGAVACARESRRCRRHRSDAASLDGMIDDVFTPVEREPAQIPTHEIDELLLLSSWFRRFPEELERTSASAGVVALASAE